jgi:peroxiredoxin Q/BCP
MPLEVGDSVPEICARNQHGEVIKPDFSTPTILYFYPEDDTPGCTTEACQFESERSTYESAGVTIYGVSSDDIESHATFADAYDVDFDLLADPDSEIIEAFDIKTTSGRAERTTFFIDDGEVQAVYENVSPDGHARELGLDLHEEGLVNFEW